MFTLQITPATGAYTFTLLDQLDHGLGTNDTDEALIDINFASVLVATDADGDFVPLSGAFMISVENDIPAFRTTGSVGGGDAERAVVPIADRPERQRSTGT